MRPYTHSGRLALLIVSMAALLLLSGLSASAQTTPSLTYNLWTIAGQDGSDPAQYEDTKAESNINPYQGGYSDPCSTQLDLFWGGQDLGIVGLGVSTVGANDDEVSAYSHGETDVVFNDPSMGILITGIGKAGGKLDYSFPITFTPSSSDNATWSCDIKTVKPRMSVGASFVYEALDSSSITAFVGIDLQNWPISVGYIQQFVSMYSCSMTQINGGKIQTYPNDQGDLPIAYQGAITGIVNYQASWDTEEEYSLSPPAVVNCSINIRFPLAFSNLSPGLIITGPTGKVYAASTVTSFSSSAKSVTGGTTITGKATIGTKAPAGGYTILLSSSNPSVVQSTTVTMPAGAKSVSFSIPTASVNAQTKVTITASLGGVGKSVTLTVNP